MKFYDLELQSSLSVGTSSPEEIAQFAQKLGFDGIAFCEHWSGMSDLKAVAQKLKALQKDYGIEIFHGVKIVTQSVSELRNTINRVRENVLLVCVGGGDYAINRAACENSKVDILCHPSLGRTDNGLDEPCLKAAARNEVAIQINFREIFNSYRRKRAIALGNIITNIRLCRALRAKLIICSGAQCMYEMRDPRELISIANVLGLDLPNCFAALSQIPAQIVEKNRKKLEGKIITKGVEIVEAP